MTEITILNWNIFWGLGYPKSKSHQILKGCSYLLGINNKSYMEKISKQINTLKPEFVTLQEIDAGSFRNRRHNQIKYLSKQLSMKYQYYAVEKDWLNYFNDGNGIISNYKPISVKIEQLPFKIEKRNAVFTEYVIDNKKFTIITTHLGAHKSNKDERLKQIELLIEKINKLANPIILIGDFNCEPNDEEFQKLVTKTKMKHIINQKTYPTHNPSKTYDNILISKNIRVIESKVINTTLSDHFPIFAKLEIN